MSSRRTRIDGRTLSVSNLDKVLYPATGTTKAEMIAYELAVAEAKLRHLAGRPVTFRRYPEGVDDEGFMQKRCPGTRPRWLGTLEVGAGDADPLEQCDIREPAGLVWAANLAALEFHVPLARAPALQDPTAVVFDLDPGEPAGLLACAQVALRLRTIFEDLGLESFPKTSGGKGLQVYLPITAGSASYRHTRSFARAVGRLMEVETPERVVTNQARRERPGKVLVDWLQNHASRTTVCAYSARGRERPRVSTPLMWDEIGDAVRLDRDDGLRFELWSTVDRLREFGDLFEGVDTYEQQLPPLP